MPAADGGLTEPFFLASIISGVGAALAGLSSCVAGDIIARYPRAASTASAPRVTASACSLQQSRMPVFSFWGVVDSRRYFGQALSYARTRRNSRGD